MKQLEIAAEIEYVRPLPYYLSADCRQLVMGYVHGHCQPLDEFRGLESFRQAVIKLARESRLIRQKNGLWRQHDGPRYKRVSGVLIASRLRPWCMPQSRLTLYLNPWADFPLANEFADLEVAKLGDDGHLVRSGEPTLSSALCPAGDGAVSHSV